MSAIRHESHAKPYASAQLTSIACTKAKAPGFRQGPIPNQPVPLLVLPATAPLVTTTAPTVRGAFAGRDLCLDVHVSSFRSRCGRMAGVLEQRGEAR
jgi:hypothetical protein